MNAWVSVAGRLRARRSLTSRRSGVGMEEERRHSMAVRYDD
jgi:hypothetical protein